MADVYNNKINNNSVPCRRSIKILVLSTTRNSNVYLKHKGVVCFTHNLKDECRRLPTLTFGPNPSVENYYYTYCTT